MRIVFMGTPDFAVPSLKALVEAGHEICGVFTQPDKPKNRGMKLQHACKGICRVGRINGISTRENAGRGGAGNTSDAEPRPDCCGGLWKNFARGHSGAAQAGVHQCPFVPTAQVPGCGPH